MDNTVGIDSGSTWGQGTGQGRAMGQNWDNCNRTTIKIIINKLKSHHRASNPKNMPRGNNRLIFGKTVPC